MVHGYFLIEKLLVRALANGASCHVTIKLSSCAIHQLLRRPKFGPCVITDSLGIDRGLRLEVSLLLSDLILFVFQAIGAIYWPFLVKELLLRCMGASSISCRAVIWIFSIEELLGRRLSLNLTIFN